MKLRTILLLVAGMLVATAGNAIQVTSPLNVSATISTGTGTCTIAATPITFSIPSNWTSGSTWPGQSSIGVTCPSGANVTVGLDYGTYYQLDNATPNRFVSDGTGNGFAYRLYVDQNYLNEWGDGSVTYNGAMIQYSSNGSTANLPVYGLADPTHSAGSLGTGISYIDTVNVVVNF